MKKFIFLFAAFIVTGNSFAQKKTFYDFQVKNINGKTIDLKQFEGKKVLVVNVASKCGYTPQYKQLEWLYSHYKDSNLVILGFPSNDFNHQEPGTSEEIKEFCTKNYGVTFPMMSKIDVIGKDCAPLYYWLQHKSENGFQDNTVQWNFNKFMIGEKGQLQGYAPSKVLPDDHVVIDWIMKK